MSKLFWKVTSGPLVVLSLLVVFAPIVAGGATLLSLMASASPTGHNFAGFMNFYQWWFYPMAVFNAAMCVSCNANTRDGTIMKMILFALAVEVAMGWRIDDQAMLFPEVLILIGITTVLFVLECFKPQAAAQQEVLNPPVALGGYSGAGNAQPEQHEIRYKAVAARYSFGDVVGMRETKSRLLAAGREVVAARKGGTQARNGVLLSGKPGNGKTFMAEALAGELQLPFLAVSFGEVASKYINSTTEQVVKVFRDAAAQAPCVLFIDEVDSLIAERNSSSSYEEGAKTTNTILTELVNIRRMGVLVIAATNFIDRLDAAAIREGRFDFKIEIPAPDAEARRHLIRRKCSAPISDETVETAVRRWEGFSVARISAIVDEACRQSRSLVMFDTLQTALRTIQGRMGSIPEDTPTLDQLTMGEQNKQRLTALARRMDRIMEIEAMGGSVPRGVLFYGPPGTGKTLTARALAKSVNWAFLSVSGMDLMADPKRIDVLVEQASDLRPCIVFIDEADDVFRDRRYSNSTTVTNKLLAAMDGANGKVPDILYIAATNHPDAMDAAALRGGRFTEKIEFGLPDSATVLEYLHKWKHSTKASLAPSFAMEAASQSLAGHPIANIKEILQMAVNNAIARIDLDEDDVSVTMDDLTAAIQSVDACFDAN